MSDKPEIQITDAEWEVMQGVWQADDQTPAEIITRVQPLRQRSHRTIRTLLTRLVDKGAVSVRVEGTQYLYRAAASRDACIRAAATSFRKRFFGGDVTSLLTHFVEHESLTEVEIGELRRKLDQICGGQSKQRSKAKTPVDRNTPSGRSKSK